MCSENANCEFLTVVSLKIQVTLCRWVRRYRHLNKFNVFIARGWMVRGSNTGDGEIFHSRPDQPWGPPSLLYSGYRVSLPGVKRPGRGVKLPPLPSSAEVKERVDLYFYSLSGPSGSVLARPFFHSLICKVKQSKNYLALAEKEALRHRERREDLNFV
jgi:hypothetical protein